ncbi:glycosyltransferase, partial [Salmonella enterica subsp. enterica serovar Wichita]|nr:glycosyltransferase [Salmonella enterica subsp. enterica serovar Wichita]
IIIANGKDASEIATTLKGKINTSQQVKVIETCIGQLGFSLNLAISQSNYDIIARMDSDDIAHPDRLEKQITYLEKNNLDLVGTAINLIDENDIFLGLRTYPQKNEIFKKIIFKNPFAHPSVMFRKAFFLKHRGYSGGFNSEDYDLWLRMRDSTPRWDNMEEPLLNYRIHSNSTQRSKLAYYECASYSLREFLKKRKMINFIACIYHFSKALIK